MNIAGIDPGLNGAIAIIDFVNKRVCDYIKMPVIQKEIETDRFREFLQEYEVKKVILEQSQPMPKQGVISVFNYGMHYGEIKGIIGMIEIPLMTVSPQRWKREMCRGLPSGKEASIIKVNQLYPHLKLKKSDNGISDAILIALWGIKYGI